MRTNQVNGGHGQNKEKAFYSGGEIFKLTKVIEEGTIICFSFIFSLLSRENIS